MGLYVARDDQSRVPFSVDIYNRVFALCKELANWHQRLYQSENETGFSSTKMLNHLSSVKILLLNFYKMRY